MSSIRLWANDDNNDNHNCADNYNYDHDYHIDHNNPDDNDDHHLDYFYLHFCPYPEPVQRRQGLKYLLLYFDRIFETLG